MHIHVQVVYEEQVIGGVAAAGRQQQRWGWHENVNPGEEAERRREREMMQHTTEKKSQRERDFKPFPASLESGYSLNSEMHFRSFFSTHSATFFSPMLLVRFLSCNILLVLFFFLLAGNTFHVKCIPLATASPPSAWGTHFHDSLSSRIGKRRMHHGQDRHGIDNQTCTWTSSGRMGSGMEVKREGTKSQISCTHHCCCLH